MDEMIIEMNNDELVDAYYWTLIEYLILTAKSMGIDIRLDEDGVTDLPVVVVAK